MAESLIGITLCWSLQPRQVHEQERQVPQGSTIQDVLDGLSKAPQSSTVHTTVVWPEVASTHTDTPEAALTQLPFLTPGIWGRKADWDTLVHEGDRIEFYRPLTVDPKVARRQRFKRQGKGRTGLFANRKKGAAAGY